MSKQNITWQSVPNGYAHCIHSDCPQAQTCLRAIAFSVLPCEERWVNIVNPKGCSKDADCPHYKDSRPQQYACGFRCIQQELLPRQYDDFMSKLISRFGRNEYFRRRRGDRPMPPAEQAFIRQVLKEIGAPDTLDFDSYEVQLSWRD